MHTFDKELAKHGVHIFALNVLLGPSFTTIAPFYLHDFEAGTSFEHMAKDLKENA